MEILINEIYICKSCLLKNYFLGEILKKYNNTCLVRIIACSEIDLVVKQELNFFIIVKKQHIFIIEETMSEKKYTKLLNKMNNI